MMLFCKPSNMVSNRVIIPLNRVYDIYCLDVSLSINYDSGELVEVEGTFQKKLESVRITFESADELDKIVRQFYKALNSGSNAFYFG